jgi:carbon storage regulator
MLYFTRKVTEKVVIMNEVVVQIVKIEEDRVQIGITAPPDVPVHRYEVLKKITASQQE